MDLTGGEDAAPHCSRVVHSKGLKIFGIKCRWTLDSLNAVPFLTSTLGYDIENTYRYHFDLSLLRQKSSCMAPERWGLKTSETFWTGYIGSQQTNEPAKGKCVFLASD